MLIENGTIIDGTGKEKFLANLRIERDTIKEIGALTARKGERVIDAKNQFVAPGFIDIINRSDIHFSLFTRSGLRSLLKQGVTSILGGNCGASLAPLSGMEAIKSIQKWHTLSGVNINWATTGEFLDEVGRHRLSINFGTLTGHATLRRGTTGEKFQKLTYHELKKMEYLLEQSLEEGSFGFSTGLAYAHERIVDISEVKRLLKVAEKKNRMWTIHLRDEGARILSSLDEIIALARELGIRSHISHLKALGADAWGEFRKCLQTLHRAKESGAPVSFDLYPYDQTATVLYLLLPDWATEGPRSHVLKRLGDPAIRKRIKEELESKKEAISKIIIAYGDIDRTFIGKSLQDIAANQESSVIDALLDAIIISGDRVIGFMPVLDEANIRLGIKSEIGIVASDGAGYDARDRKEGMLVHPRSFGAFPRFLGTYVRESRLVSWEAAIGKITSFPAEIMGLVKRGKIAKGYAADIVIFDPKKISDCATFRDPFQYAEGISYVIVNGGVALRKGKFQKARYGRVLRK